MYDREALVRLIGKVGIPTAVDTLKSLPSDKREMLSKEEIFLNGEINQDFISYYAYTARI